MCAIIRPWCFRSSKKIGIPVVLQQHFEKQKDIKTTGDLNRMDLVSAARLDDEAIMQRKRKKPRSNLTK